MVSIVTYFLCKNFHQNQVLEGTILQELKVFQQAALA